MSDDDLQRLRREAAVSSRASDWSRLAHALARAGQDGECRDAARRALALDPGDPASELLTRRRSGHRDGTRLAGSAPWPGLRVIAGARTLGRAPVRPGSSLDLGRGIVVSERRHAVVAHSVFTGEEHWSLPFPDDAPPPRLAVAGERLVLASVEAGVLLVRVLEPRGGREEARLEHPLPAGDEALQAVVLDEGTVAVLASTLPPGERGEEERTLVLADLASGRARELALGGNYVQLVAVHGVLVASVLDLRRVVAFTAEGERLWELEGSLNLLGAVDGRIAASTWEPLACARFLEARTGRVAAEVALGGAASTALATERRIVLVTSGDLVALDRTTLAKVRESPYPHRGAFASTGDALLAIPLQGRIVREVAALDPEGEELARFPLADAGALAAPLLASGKLLLPVQRGAAFLAVEGAP